MAKSEELMEVHDNLEEVIFDVETVEHVVDDVQEIVVVVDKVVDDDDDKIVFALIDYWNLHMISTNQFKCQDISIIN